MPLIQPLPKQVQKELRRISNAYTSPGNLSFRARIILLASEGKSHKEISRRLKTTLKTVAKWINRFNLNPRIDTLKDADRSGRPPTIPSFVKCEVIKFACCDAKSQSNSFVNTWTIKALQKCVQQSSGWLISKSEINRILNHKALRPHKIKMWLHSPDPLFRQKVNKIAALYLTPPEDAIVLCVDEKSGMQAIERKISVSPKHSGCKVRLDYEYKRHGTRTLIAAYNPKSGEVFGKCGKSRKKEDIMHFMEELAVKYPTGDVYIIWDNLNIHQGYAWYAFNQRHGKRFHFAYTPVHGSWVNQIEVWFGILQRKVIKNSSFRSEEELERAVLEYITHWNKRECHPFKWQFRGYQEEAA